jgi:hypothetical protein
MDSNGRARPSGRCRNGRQANTGRTKFAYVIHHHHCDKRGNCDGCRPRSPPRCGVYRRHAPLQSTNRANVTPAPVGSPGHQTPGARKPTFSFILGSLAYDRRLRSDSYDPQRPGVLECSGSEGRSTAPLHSRSVRCDELNFRSSTPPSARLQSCNTS